MKYIEINVAPTLRQLGLYDAEAEKIEDLTNIDPKDLDTKGYELFCNIYEDLIVDKIKIALKDKGNDTRYILIRDSFKTSIRIIESKYPCLYDKSRGLILFMQLQNMFVKTIIDKYIDFELISSENDVILLEHSFYNLEF